MPAFDSGYWVASLPAIAVISVWAWSSETPSFSRAIDWIDVASRAGPEPLGKARGSILSGSQASICPGKSKFSGMTPTMVVGWLFARIVRPMTSGSLWKRSCHARWLKSMTGGVDG